MGKRLALVAAAPAVSVDLPSADVFAVLRAWYCGLSVRQAVDRYLGDKRPAGASSRGILGRARRQLAAAATRRHRPDLAELFGHPDAERAAHAQAVLSALESLRTLALPSPALSDDVAAWLPTRPAAALRAAGIGTLADVVVRRARRRRWWAAVPRFGAAAAAAVETLLTANPTLLQRSRELVERAPDETRPWEDLVIPADADGSKGTFRSPKGKSTLAAKNDYQAVNAWLALHEVASTVRAYRKEAERLMLWAILERGRPLSSLTTEDAIAFRAFLRRPMPASRWVGPSVPRASAEWRPFQGSLSPRSVGYALDVLNAMYRWLVEQRYLVANPFSGVRGKVGPAEPTFDTSHVFNDHEWALLRPMAQDLELLGWTSTGAQRMRFVLDFAYATGLRPGEMVRARLGNVQQDEHGDSWLHVVGKGSKPGRVALPTMAIGALDRYLAERGLPVTPHLWNPKTPLIANLDDEFGGLTTSRLWVVMRRFFALAAKKLQGFSPKTADKLLRATPHWMRHTHATHALAHGAELVMVRDNLRHASIATTSIYLHGDDVQRARQMREAFN